MTEAAERIEDTSMCSALLTRSTKVRSHNCWDHITPFTWSKHEKSQLSYSWVGLSPGGQGVTHWQSLPTCHHVSHMVTWMQEGMCVHSPGKMKVYFNPVMCLRYICTSSVTREQDRRKSVGHVFHPFYVSPLYEHHEDLMGPQLLHLWYFFLFPVNK